jgi:hypothetical protein
VTQDQLIAFLRSIGCEGQAGDVASLRFADRLITAVEIEAARYARESGAGAVAEGLLAGEHWRARRTAGEGDG